MRRSVGFLLAIAILGSIFVFAPFLLEKARAPEFSTDQAENILTRIEELKRRAQEITSLTPQKDAATQPGEQTEGGAEKAPLTQLKEEPGAEPLDSDTIVVWTNQYRINNDKTPLTQNARLTEAALTKARDILERQYFAHTAPDGTKASDLARQAGYAYLSVGENLALGNYEGSKGVVDAWMDSPGHRENILRDYFEEIGVAAIKGTYEGQEVWVAVQIFGRPESACPQPDPELKETIETYRTQMDELSSYLDEEREALESTEDKRTSEYRERVRDYNNTVKYAQELSTMLQEAIDEYNVQVNAYNACLKDE